jgi:hypothetical protein
MRLVSTILLTLIFACLLLAQAPIGFGPGTLSAGLLDLFDWYAATASGCTPGARGMCVGHGPLGDTIYFTGWFANANLLPVTTGLPVVGTLNDFTAKTCSGNIMVIQLAEFSWSARNASRIYEVNCMSGFGASPGAIDTPTGWKGHCTSGDAPGGEACTWKSRAPFVRNGKLYLPVERQVAQGTTSIHDATLIVSADGGQTWKNPYTVAHGGAASATGDTPLCGAVNGNGGSPCTDASYPGSIMWPAMPLMASQWEPVQFGQDGATPPAGINDGCDPATYTCFLSGEQEMTVSRVLNTDLPSLDVTKWQYYTCPAITDTYRCPGSASSSWTSTFANRTSVARMLIPSNNKFGTWNGIFGIAYIKEFKSYLLTGYQNSGTGQLANSNFAWAPTIQGPWTTVLSAPMKSDRLTTLLAGFMSPALALGYTVVGTNPPHVKLTTVTDDGYYSSQTTPFFGQWDLVLGRAPMLQAGENPRSNSFNGSTTNAGYIFSDSHAPGTVARKDLVWAFDFYDHGGDTSMIGASNNSPLLGFHDVANGSAFLLGLGVTWTPFGANLEYGYGPYFMTMTHDQPQTIASAATHASTGGLTPQNAPAAMQGNGTFTVAGVFRIDASSYGMTPFWTTGDDSSSNTRVSLSYYGGAPSLELAWGLNGDRWRYNSGFAPSTNQWYFIACTVQANGATPIGHMWTGIGGALVDKIAGVSRAATGGSPTQTPNVVATPLVLGTAIGDSYTTNASYGGLFVYGRALSRPEVGLMYRTVQAKMAARGVTVQ